MIGGELMEVVRRANHKWEVKSKSQVGANHKWEFLLFKEFGINEGRERRWKLEELSQMILV